MRKSLTLICAVGCLLMACGSDDTSEAKPQIVVTTSILGDVVSEAVGELADVEVIMPRGADPHGFSPSARQAEAMENADLLVINGAGFEAGMLDVVENVERSGTEVFSFADQIELLTVDPHFWTDPRRMSVAVEALGTELGRVDGLDGDAIEDRVNAYVAELDALDRDMEVTLSSVPPGQRVLVTNHEVFNYFADRFDFEVVGAVIPSMTTNAESSAAEIEDLAALISEEGVPAIFGETTQSTQLAEALAAEVGGDVKVVVLFSESLGDDGSGADTYLGMMRTNATLIADALTMS